MSSWMRVRGQQEGKGYWEEHKGYHTWVSYLLDVEVAFFEVVVLRVGVGARS